ncbi:hypothetical protein BGW80DRAFT_1329305, partial [Lactifluus volemus]
LWCAPIAWPPHQYIAMPQAMRALPDNGLIPQLPKRKSGFALAHWLDGRPCRINLVSNEHKS